MSPVVRRVLVGVFVVGAAFTTGQERLSACSCIESNAACESIWTTDAVFVGTVVDIGPLTEDTKSEFPWKRRPIRFTVSEVFKGPSGPDSSTLVVFTGQGDADCGYRFVADRTYLVYAHRHPVSGELGTGICSRTADVANAAADLAYLRGAYAQPADLGSVRGVVQRADGAAGPRRETPYAGAQLRLEGYAQAWQTVSADDGTYEFRVPAGEYRLKTRVPEGVYAWPGEEGRVVTLHDPRGCVISNIGVRSDGRIRGRVVDALGRPAPFLSVELIDEARVASRVMSASVRTATDADGRFEFAQLPAGRYAAGLTLRREVRAGMDLAVWLDAEGSGRTSVISVEPEQRTDAGTLRLPASIEVVTVEGVVVDGRGDPVAGAMVRFVDPGSQMSMLGAQVPTDARGRFTLSVQTGRQYRLLVEWRSSVPGVRDFRSTRSEVFDAQPGVRPFRLVLS